MKYRKQTLAALSVLLGLILLLPLLTACQGQSDASHGVIPEGWEAVSTEGDITFLQMKEGIDAYHWTEYDRLYSHKQEYYVIDWELPGGTDPRAVSADANGNVQVIVYYGYMYLQYYSGISEYVMQDLPENFLNRSDQLRMKRSADNTDRAITQIRDGNTLAFQNVQSGYPATYRVGFTRAVMISLPISQWKNGACVTEFLVATPEEDGGYGYNETIFMNATVWNDRIYFSRDALKEEFNQFPFSLLDEDYGLYVVLYYLLAMALMIASAMMGKSRRIHWIPCVIGIVHTVGAIIHAIIFRISCEGVFGMSFGEQGRLVWLIFMLFRFIEWGVLLWLIRKLTDRIKLRIREKRMAKREESDSPDEIV